METIEINTGYSDIHCTYDGGKWWLSCPATNERQCFNRQPKERQLIAFADGQLSKLGWVEKNWEDFSDLEQQSLYADFLKEGNIDTFVGFSAVCKYRGLWRVRGDQIELVEF